MSSTRHPHFLSSFSFPNAHSPLSPSFVRFVVATLLLSSLPHLNSAIHSYSLISLFSSHLHALRLQATVLDALGPDYHEQRDEVALEYGRVEEGWERVRGVERSMEGGLVGGAELAEEGSLEESLREVWECAKGVMEVGVGISLGRV